MSRKTAREVAMKLAFASLFGGEETYEAVLDKSGIEDPPTAEDVRFSQEVLAGIEAHKQDIDDTIGELAVGWRIGRMPRVDLSILRIAIFEMLYRPDIPNSVSINEAVELAKSFGGDRSPAYINGMLGTLAKKMEKGVFSEA